MWNPHHSLACISRPQSLQPDPAAWGCCLLQLRIYLKGVESSNARGVMLFLPHDLSCSVSSCTTEKSRSHPGSVLPWYAKQAIAHLTGNYLRDRHKDLFQPWVTSACQHLSLVQGLWAENQGRRTFLNGLWNPSFTSYGIIAGPFSLAYFW